MSRTEDIFGANIEVQFSLLSKLIRIDLSNNYLTSIYEGIFEGLYALKYLYLHENLIETIETRSIA